MTTNKFNKPEIEAYLITNRDGADGSIRGVRLAENLDTSCTNENYLLEPLVRLSDYEALQDEYESLRKDAERYRWLRDTLHNAKAGGGVEVNDALQVYETPVQGEEVRIYWYQDTPVGFYQIEATTLDGAIDEAMEQQT